jgi:hypothetical protein
MSCLMDLRDTSDKDTLLKNIRPGLSDNLHEKFHLKKNFKPLYDINLDSVQITGSKMSK